jgi:hypothetical protein
VTCGFWLLSNKAGTSVLHVLLTRVTWGMCIPCTTSSTVAGQVAVTSPHHIS